MIPRARELVSLDIYRDGGSLSVTHKDESDVKHELMFSIDNRASEASEPKKIFKCASIISYIRSEYASPVTDVASPKIDEHETGITWLEAAKSLQTIEPYLEGFKSEYLWVFSSMVTIANSKDNSVEFS